MRIASLMRRLSLAIVSSLFCFALVTAAKADIVARVSLSSQQMIVYIDGTARYDWVVSTARPGYHTPTGSFRPTRLAKMWYSKKYDNSPMPNSVFFLGGYAVHGTYYVKMLGRPASHGCVRLHPEDAQTLFGLIADAGLSNSKIVITQ